ncbi:CYTH domain-containing protein [Maribacter arenosus]|uniref:CYTH domain-containing protein n=1 Tax=Maribacter arenosus TaxID=1854708 RepID=A0ABR7VCD8_9FLAO|nr:CYTH domain-containing protein [Maribacter arenosus]MBD0851330.1 CYTH domain-containing protein [Maribacter arenosus]
MVEIERKFLVKGDTYRKEASSKTRIVQGFLNTHPNRTVRVRVKGDLGFITVKGISNGSGTSRFEWEKEIDLNEAEALLQLCEETVIKKNRYEIPLGNYIFEVDEFLGANEGLVIAEIELQDEKEVFERPEWLGEEVTGDLKYYNSILSKQPYKSW